MLYSKSLCVIYFIFMASLEGGSAHKESTCNAGDLDSIPRLARSPGEGRSYPLQYFGLGKFMDSVHGLTKSWTRLSDFHFHFIVIVVCICQLPFPSLYFPFSPCNHKFVFHICDSISVL